MRLSNSEVQGLFGILVLVMTTCYPRVKMGFQVVHGWSGHHVIIWRVDVLPFPEVCDMFLR